jgi:uncharacterized DUF497 family protein
MSSIIDQLVKCVGFEWDQGNLLKNWEKHGVSAAECEQIFFNRPLITAQDEKHSKGGKTILRLGTYRRPKVFICSFYDQG